MAKSKPRIINIEDINSNFKKISLRIPVHINYFDTGVTKTGDKSYRDIDFVFCKLRNGTTPKWCLYDFKFMKSFMKVDAKRVIRDEYLKTRNGVEGSHLSGFQTMRKFIDEELEKVSSKNIESIHFNNSKVVRLDDVNYYIPINIDINIKDIGMRKYKIYSALI